MKHVRRPWEDNMKLPKHMTIGTTKLLVLDLIMQNPGVSIREISATLGKQGLQGIQEHLYKLRELGLITWDEHRNRTLRATCEFIGVDEL